MKLILAIIRDDYAADVLAALTEEGLSATRISSTGGFWRRGGVARGVRGWFRLFSTGRTRGTITRRRGCRFCGSFTVGCGRRRGL